MAIAIVLDETTKDILDTLEEMTNASDEIAANCARMREEWWARERSIAMLFEALRIQFNAFASAAMAARVRDAATLNTIGRLFEDVAVTLGEVCFVDGASDLTAIQVRNHVAKMSERTGQICTLIESVN
jgi:hypothetical protein